MHYGMHCLGLGLGTANDSGSWRDWAFLFFGVGGPRVGSVYFANFEIPNVFSSHEFVVLIDAVYLVHPAAVDKRRGVSSMISGLESCSCLRSLLVFRALART